MFLIIGGLNTLVSMGGMLLLYEYAGFGYWGSSAFMFTVCSVFSFVFNRKYSFKSDAPLMQSIIRFAVVIAVCYFIAFGLSAKIAPIILGYFFTDISVKLTDQISMLFAQCIFTFLNYLGQRLWAFKK